MFCTQCGHQNLDDSHFCARCGTALQRAGATPAAGPAGTLVAERPAEMTSTISLTPLENGEDPAGRHPHPARDQDGRDADGNDPDGDSGLEGLLAGSSLLVVKRGPNAGSRFLLDADTITAGRHPESDIFLDDVTVSRRHAEFVREGAGFVVRDVGSLNGTYLNRERIESAALTGGDEVQIGKYRLVFLTGGRGEAG